MATRYKIILEWISYEKGNGFKKNSCSVCTCLDERKAIVMATWGFNHDHPNGHIFQVLKMEKLEGDKALPRDIDDRLEY